MTTKDVILTITLMLAAGLGAELVAELLRIPPMPEGKTPWDMLPAH